MECMCHCTTAHTWLLQSIWLCNTAWTAATAGWVWAAVSPSAISTKLQSECITCLPWSLQISGFQNFWMSRMTSDDGQRKASHAQCCPRTARCKCSILHPEMQCLAPRNAVSCTEMHYLVPRSALSCTQKCSLALWKKKILHPEMWYLVHSLSFSFPVSSTFAKRLLIYMWNFTVFVLMQLGLCFHQTQNIFSKTKI